MDKNFLRIAMKLAASIVLVTLMVITGLSLVKQELPSLQIAEYNVLNNFQLADGLHQPKEVREMPKKVQDMPEKVQDMPEKVQDMPEKVRDLPEKVRDLPRNGKIIPIDMCNPPGSCRKEILT